MNQALMGILFIAMGSAWLGIDLFIIASGAEASTEPSWMTILASLIFIATGILEILGRRQ